MAKEQKSRETEIVIDLEKELAPEELRSFREKAREAKADLTEHFKNVFLRVGQEEKAS